MKLKLKRRFLLLPTLLVGSLLTAACTDNTQTTSNTLNTKSSDQTGSDAKGSNAEHDNKFQDKTTEAHNLEKDKNANAGDSTSMNSMDHKVTTTPNESATMKNGPMTPNSKKSTVDMPNKTDSGTSSDSQVAGMPQSTSQVPSGQMTKDGTHQEEGDASMGEANGSESVMPEGGNQKNPGTGREGSGGSETLPDAPSSSAPGNHKPQTGASTQHTG